ncbi:MAG: response regulator [Bacteroidales bacterium]|nr:response regulator [Bacteroidales bacterium]
MRRFITFILLFAGLSSTVLRGERYYYFEHLKTTDGLPSNTIYCAMQDKSGFMWIGTRDGLCRYDGQNFTRLSVIAPEHKLTGLVMAVAEDSAGKIWFSSAVGVGYYDPYTDESGSLGLIGGNMTFDIETDRNGNIWFASESLFRYDTETSGMHTYSFRDTQPSILAVDSLGTLWVLMRDGTVYTYDRLKDVFTQQNPIEKIKHIKPISDGRMLVATDTDDVYTLDCISLRTEEVYKAVDGRAIRCLCEGDNGEFWIGTDNGLFIRRENEAYNGEAFHSESTPASISADFITSIDKDQSGNMWIGTYYTGINIWRNTQDEMSIFFSNPSDNSIKGDIVRSICSDRYGVIWFCTEDGWLNRLDPQNNSVRNFQIKDVNNMHALVVDGDNLWICTYGNGVYLFDINKEKVIKKYHLPSGRTSTGMKTKEGDLYIGTVDGLYIFDRSSDSFALVESMNDSHIHCLFQDWSGMIWIGTYGDGIYCMDRKGKVLSHTTQVKDNGNGLTSRFITSFFEDSRHRIWVTTEGGGVCHTGESYDIENLRFSSISTNDGLPSDVTCAITEDKDGSLWISTTNGIVSISGKDLAVTGLVNGSNEVTGYQYSYGAVCTSRTGVFYFGNTDGMIALTPSKIGGEDKTYDLQITSIEARSSDHAINLKNPGKSALTSDEIKVRHKDASAIHIGFTVPEYSTRKIIYRYSLTKGKKELFSSTTQDNHVMLSGLRPGKYRFDINTVDSRTPSSAKSLKIRIMPHPMLSTFAYLIYCLIIVTLFILGIIMLEVRNRNEKARQYSKLMNKKEKEIYNAKINFFTNITHEIRTPLTLIKMPIDKIMASKKYAPETEKDLKTIQANTDRLLSLTNQILDMRKMERNEMKLSFIREDLCAIVKKAISLFEQMAADQHIRISVSMPAEPVNIMCAKDSVLTIISNLLSNAVKYGNEQINIIVDCKDNITATVRVESDGEIIPETEREKIFQIFFQREGAAKEGQGTGLGLPYARNLANMHNGKLYLDGSVLDMNSFILELPVEQEEQVKIIVPSKTPKNTERENVEFDNSRHTILVVEDSEELRDYLADELASDYNIRTAVNGADALDMVKSDKIDLVISDIMMPVMDGCELCNAIKNDSDLSHIPVILLTAVVGTETRIETLEVGADGYIEKPFPIELLRSNINNLFKNKEISYRQFMNKPLTHYSSVTASKLDQEYMDKVHEFIMKHIAETDLNIENLTLQLGTSKSSLYRKLKANTGLSINEYIRLCRLKQAAELLSSQKYKINEVAFMTGFSSPSYFATCFQKQFNITPSEFVKNLGQ